MDQMTVGQEVKKDYRVSLYKTKSMSGRHRFLAETLWEDGDKFLIDHWNLSSLERIIREVIPVVQEVRAWNQRGR